MHKLGAGPEPIPARKLSAQRLADALVEATNSDGLRARAQGIGERIRAEDGVSRAVEIVKRHVEAVA